MLTDKERESVDCARDALTMNATMPSDVRRLLAIIDRLQRPDVVLAEAERLIAETKCDVYCLYGAAWEFNTLCFDDRDDVRGTLAECVAKLLERGGEGDAK